MYKHGDMNPNVPKAPLAVPIKPEVFFFTFFPEPNPDPHLFSLSSFSNGPLKEVP